MFYYYKVRSSHWITPAFLEFKSKTKLKVGQCFRITDHDGSRPYPTRFKVVSVSDTPEYTGTIVEIRSMDLTVDEFE
jgi:hypothetical protein